MPRPLTPGHGHSGSTEDRQRMSPIILLSLVLQLACCVHVVRTGRPLYWIFILLVFSYLAVLVYLIAEVLPDLRNTPAARRASRKLRSQIDPGHERRQADSRLGLADTVENRRQLAIECLRGGDYVRAEELFSTSLRGIHRTDPHLMLGLAQALYGQGKAAETRQMLESLIAANPGFRSSDGHLLYARAVEDLGDTGAAVQEYEAVVQDYPGEEARVRYGMLLKRAGHADEARRVFDETLERARLLPDYYQREQREWINRARSELASLPPA